MRRLLLVGLGGFVGSASRYLVSGWAHRLFPMTTFPVGTLLVNTLGCFLIGGAAGAVDGRQLFGPEARLFLLIGVLGGFTTFSTFAHETVALTRGAEMLHAGINVVLQLVLGLGSAWIGYALTRG